MTPAVGKEPISASGLQGPTPDNGGTENAGENLRKSNLKHRETAARMRRAARLAEAIADADPEDARQVMTAALIDLHEGLPPSEVILDTRSKAQDWARKAGEIELVTLADAALAQIHCRALHLQHRKALMRRLYLSLPLESRIRFMHWAREAEG